MSDTVRTWRHIQQRYNLVGSKCTTCGQVFFPQRVICPDCRRKGNIEDIQFSGKGKIFLKKSRFSRRCLLVFWPAYGYNDKIRKNSYFRENESCDKEVLEHGKRSCTHKFHLGCH
mgnify:CR=1 FL=1